MNKRWTKLISVVCLVAMLIGMLPVVASAADGVYTADFSAESTDTAGGAHTLTSIGESGYFTLVYGEKGYISDGTSGKDAAGFKMGNSFRFGGKTSKYQTDAHIEFTTTNDNATVEVWIYNSGNGDRTLQVYNDQGVQEGTDTVSANKNTGHGTIKLGTAGKYYIVSPVGDLMIGKVVVTDKAAAVDPAPAAKTAKPTYTSTAVEVAEEGTVEVTNNNTSDGYGLYAVTNDTETIGVSVEANTITITGKKTGTATVYTILSDTEFTTVDDIAKESNAVTLTVTVTAKAPDKTFTLDPDDLDVAVTVDTDETITAAFTGYGDGAKVYAKSKEVDIATVQVADKVITIHGVAAGTTEVYVAVSETELADADAVKNAEGAKTLNVTVTKVDTAKLEAAIAEAETLYNDTQESTDGTDVPTDKKWATKENLATFKEAIDTATAAIGTVDSEQAVTEAVNTLNSAKTTFEGQRQDGTKPATYTITVTEVEGATVTTDPADEAAADATVTVNVTVTDDKKEIDKVEVKDADNGDVTVTEAQGAYTFTMPAKAVTVTVTLKDKQGTVTPEPEAPTTGTYTLTFDEQIGSGSAPTVNKGDVWGPFDDAHKGDTFGAKADGGFFTVYTKTSGASRFDSGAKEFPDGSSLNYCLNVQGGITTDTETGNKSGAIGFTVGAKATIKVWARSGGSDDRAVGVYTLSDANKFELVGEAATVAGSGQTVAELAVDAAGTYYVGGASSIRIYKIEVTIGAGGPDEPTVEAPVLTVGETAVSVKEGASVEVTATATNDGVITVASAADATATATYAEGKVTITGVKAGETTVTVTATNSAGKDTKTITVTVTAEDEEPPVEQPADKEALTEALKKANEVYDTAGDTVTIKPDGTKPSEVTKGTKFVTESDVKALKDEIEKAQAVVDNAEATDEEIAQALTDLNTAVEAFNNAILTGTKTTTSSSTSTSSGRNPSRGDDTDTGDDKTDGDTGSLLPDAPKTTAKKTTDSEGNTTVTVTDEDGEVLAQVQLPANVPELDYTFEDVADDAWYADAVNAMAAMGVVRGVSETDHVFDPNADITRGAMAQILFNLSNGKEGLNESFTDVAEGAWYTDAVAWAAAAGVVNGYMDNSFGPNNAITREQLATMLYRYAALLGLDTKVANTDALNGFVDASSVQSWSADAVAWAVANGLIQGKGANNLDPAASASRAETATILQRFLDLV